MYLYKEMSRIVHHTLKFTFVLSYGIYISQLLRLIGDVPMVFSYDIYISRLLFLIGDVLMALSYGIYISRLYFIFDW
jgi:hypothetical protein